MKETAGETASRHVRKMIELALIDEECNVIESRRRSNMLPHIIHVCIMVLDCKKVSEFTHYEIMKVMMREFKCVPFMNPLTREPYKNSRGDYEGLHSAIQSYIGTRSSDTIKKGVFHDPKTRLFTNPTLRAKNEIAPSKGNGGGTWRVVF